MDDDSNSNPLPGNGQSNPPSSYRIRRPSASIISSTTSPMFQAPPNPNLQPPPSPLAVAHHSRQRQNQNIIFNHNNNFGPGDIDDDVQPSNSRGRSSASTTSSATSSSYNGNNNRPQSPLGSPDSTAYWGPSPSPVAHHSHSNSYRAPLTPGGMCVVSSSTSDDIPQSPFSPDDIGGNTSNHGSQNQASLHRSADNRNPPSQQVDINNDNQNPINVIQQSESIPAPPLPSSGSGLATSSSASSSGSNSSNRHYLSSHTQRGNQDLNNQSPTPSTSTSSSSSSLQSFNISPLRNKIKKASSFERFSLAQAAIISNAANASTSSSNNVTNEQSISSIPPTTSSSIGTNNSNSVNVAGPSRLIWDPSPPPPSSVSIAPASEPTPSSLRSSFGGHTEKFHIKIPSKKLAAKIASVYEQEQLNESMAAAEAISAVGSASKQRPRIPSIISSGGGPPIHQTQHEGIINSHQSQHIPPSTLAQILNQSPSNINVTSIMTEESIMNPEINPERLMRELSDAPLNLTENTSNSSTSHIQQQQQTLLPQRNPVISSRSTLTSQSKKIPLTPKQKLLHRLQSGELLSSSLSPPPQLSQPIQQHQQQSLPVQTIQQQQSISAPVVTLHQSMPMVQETLQQTCGTSNNNNHIMIGSAPHSPPQQQQLDAYAYESLLRSRDDFVVQDPLSKVVSEDPNNVSNMLSVYDPDAYAYYYQSILADEIFSGNNSSTSSSRPLLMMSSGNLQDSVDQPQGHLEFVLGLNSSVDDHENDRSREDDLQLNGDENSGSQQQFLDPNDALSAMKSQSQADSTLRNLLMMEPIRNSHPDDSWLALAAAEYQNRINSSDVISRVGSRSNTQVGGNSGSSGSGVSLVNVSNNINNSWINEWPRTSSWQHPSVSIGGVQDQDEVMDMSTMSMIDHVKSSITSQNKRIQIQMQQNNDHAIDDMDLGNGLPILSSMPVNMPIDLQQPISMLQHGSACSSKDSLPMDLQQHHRMEIDDEPVNLMAVNIEQEQQELIHHTNHTNHHNQSHQQQMHQQLESKGPIMHSSSNHHQQANSYTLQIQSHSVQDLQHSLGDMSSNSSSSSSSDNIDERRIIRVKKNKDSLINPLDEGYQMSNNNNGQDQHENIIMDKPIQPKSIASLPSQLRLARVSGNELAVFNNTDKNIASNCRLGPVEGPLKKANSDDINNVNAPYPCLLLADGCNALWQLDRTDDEFCNWMKFVRIAHSIKDQNALIVESDGYLYFITCKEISPEAELQVGYSYEYAQKYGLPYLLPMEDLIEHENIQKPKLNNNPENNNSGPASPVILQDDDEIINERGQDCKSVIVNIYNCFECDQEFSLIEELQAHLNTHKEPDEIRKPKRKVLKKFQLPLTITESSIREIPNSENLVTKEQTGQNQLMSADSSMGAVESSSTINQDSIRIQGSGDVGKAQDNSVSTGGCLPLVPPKVKCQMCYKSFATKERLEKHMIVHSDEDTKPLKCNYCTKRFLTNSALAGHIKTHAEEGKFFECPMCEFSTPQLLQLKEHVQTHKNRETGLFYCPQCPKKFSAYSMIRKHIRAFHGPRQYTCDQCTMSFPTSDKLKLHRLKHSDHREFLCAQCGRQFKRKDKLREHTKRIHETKKTNIEINIPKDKNSKKFIPKVAPEEYQKFPYKCPDCMVGFKRRGMLVNHLAKKHPDKKLKNIPELNQPILRLTRNYPCLYCERVYKSSSKRKAHILKAHPGKPMPPQLRGTIATSESSNEIRPSSHIGTIVQTVTDDGDPRNGIMNVSCNITSTNNGNNGSGNNLVSTTSTSNILVIRKEAVVGKVVATPHACPWCYRQYASRAKLLQHQRKAHINLMPTEMQTPRTQKNNVAKTGLDKSEAVATTIDISAIKAERTPLSVIQSLGNDPLGNDPSLIVPDSSTSASTTTTTIQTMAAEGLSVNEANVIGFLLTTTVSASGELGMPSEIVMVPVQNLSNASTGTGINVNVLQASQSQPITINSASPSPNIAIITSSNSNNNNSNSNNKM